MPRHRNLTLISVSKMKTNLSIWAIDYLNEAESDPQYAASESWRVVEGSINAALMALPGDLALEGLDAKLGRLRANGCLRAADIENARRFNSEVDAGVDDPEIARRLVMASVELSELIWNNAVGPYTNFVVSRW